MLHDPEMEVSCDGEDCNESVFMSMSWSVGGYDITDDRAKIQLESDHSWTWIDDKQYCDECKPPN